MNIGDTVRVLAPFDEAFGEMYTITEIINYPDGQTAYILGDLGGFDAIYLELLHGNNNP